MVYLQNWFERTFTVRLEVPRLAACGGLFSQNAALRELAAIANANVLWLCF